MLLQELMNLKDAKELISVERDCHDEELTGFLFLVSDNIIGMCLIDNDGIFDGFTVFETDQIIEVFWGNREHNAIRYLSNKHSISKPPTIQSDLFQDIIIELAKQYSSICIHSHHNEDKFEVCEIENSDDEWLKIKTFGIKRTLSRLEKIFRRERISRVVVDSPYQNSIVELSETEC